MHLHVRRRARDWKVDFVSRIQIYLSTNDAMTGTTRSTRPTLSREERELRTQDTCSSYPGGPAGYRYVRDRCVKGTRSGELSGRAVERAALSAALQESRNTPTFAAFKPVPATAQGRARLASFTAYVLHEWQQAPAFMAFAVQRFSAMRRSVPDPNERYARICDDWLNDPATERDSQRVIGRFEKNRNVRAYVMRIALGAVSSCKKCKK